MQEPDIQNKGWWKNESRLMKEKKGLEEKSYFWQ